MSIKFCDKKLSRAISVLLSICLMFTGAIATGTTVFADGEIITNGGFETGDHTGWNNDANATVVTDEYHSGSYSLRLVSTGWNGYNQIFNVTPGAKYRVSWYMKTSNPNSGLNAYIQYASGGNITEWWPNGGSDWAYCEKEFTAPEGHTQLKLHFSGNTDTVRYLDDIVIEELKEPSFDGFIYNGNFETGDTTGWTNWNSSQVTAETAHNGTNSLYLNCSGWGAFFQEFNVTSGANYRLTLYFKDANSTAFGIYIKYTNAEGEKTAAEKWTSNSGLSTWKKVTVDFEAPEDVTKMTLTFTADALAQKYIDDVLIQEIKEPSFDGYIYNGDFEIGDHGAWNNGAGSNATIVNTDAHGGIYCLRLISTGWNAYSQTFAVVPGVDYKLTFYMKTNNPNQGLGVYIKNAGTDGTVVDKWVNGTSEWGRQAIEFTAPDGCDQMKLHFSGDSDTIRYLDDFKVEIAVPMSDDGYIKNGDFEIGETSQWTHWTDSSATAEAAYSGSYGLKLTAGEWKEFSQEFDVEPGYSYTLTYWLKATEQSGTGYGYIKDGNTEIEQFEIGGSIDEWQKQTVVFTAPATTTRAKLIIYAQGSVKYIDDISISGPVSYLKNAGFEKGNDSSWNNWAGLAVTGEAAHSGNYSLNYSSSGWKAFFQDFDVTPNTSYRLSLWIKDVNSEDLGIYIKNVIDNSDEDNIETWVSSGSEDWRQVTVDFTAPEGITKMRLNFTADALSEKYIDDIEIVRVGDANADGAVDATDLVALRKYLLGAKNSTANAFRADINGNGTVNIIDMISLKKQFA